MTTAWQGVKWGTVYWRKDAPAYFQSISDFLCSVLVARCEGDTFGMLVSKQVQGIQSFPDSARALGHPHVFYFPRAAQQASPQKLVAKTTIIHLVPMLQFRQGVAGQLISASDCRVHLQDGFTHMKADRCGVGRGSGRGCSSPLPGLSCG